MILPSGFSTTNYGTLANGKGWGSGWPNCGVVNKTINMTRSGMKLLVNQRTATLWEVLLNQMEKSGYLLHHPEQWSWGSECRPIGGTSTPSNHSWGLAVDINAPNNPYTTSGQHDIPDSVFAMFRKYGFGLGADYNGKKDWMHVEFMGTPGDADIMTALAIRDYSDGHIDLPTIPGLGEDDDMKLGLMKVADNQTVWAYGPGVCYGVPNLEYLTIGQKMGLYDTTIRTVGQRELDVTRAAANLGGFVDLIRNAVIPDIGDGKPGTDKADWPIARWLEVNNDRIYQAANG